MRQVLVIEDDQFKLDAVVRVLEAEGNFEIHHAQSVQGALARIGQSEFDLLILDMALPSHSVVAGESPPTSMLSGGLEVIMELSYLKRTDALVVLTQYPELEIEGELLPIRSAEEKLRTMFGTYIRGVILYEHQDAGWVDKLRALLRGVS